MQSQCKKPTKEGYTRFYDSEKVVLTKGQKRDNFFKPRLEGYSKGTSPIEVKE